MIISVTNITRRFKKKCASTRFLIGISETLVQSANNRSGQTMNKNKTKQDKTKKNGYKYKQMFLIIFLYIWIEEFWSGD